MRATPSLARLVARAAAPAPLPDDGEACDLCGTPVAAEHRHLLDIDTQELLCVCTACRILFHSTAAGGHHYQLIPARRLRIADCALDDATWQEFRIPVDVAFFTWSSRADRIVARYPGTLGAIEATPPSTTWRDFVRINPALETLSPDVEAFLVRRRASQPHHLIAPIDDCYRLVGIIRTQWKGFTGGRDVWQQIDAFFDDLARGATVVHQEEQMDHVRTGKAQVKHDTPSHVRGINEGNAEGNYEKNAGHTPDGRSTAKRSTGINAADADAIDPRMPNLSPG